MNASTRWQWLVVALLVAACGGGGGSDDETQPPASNSGGGSEGAVKTSSVGPLKITGELHGGPSYSYGDSPHFDTTANTVSDDGRYLFFWTHRESARAETLGGGRLFDRNISIHRVDFDLGVATEIFKTEDQVGIGEHVICPGSALPSSYSFHFSPTADGHTVFLLLNINSWTLEAGCTHRATRIVSINPEAPGTASIIKEYAANPGVSFGNLRLVGSNTLVWLETRATAGAFGTTTYTIHSTQKNLTSGAETVRTLGSSNGFSPFWLAPNSSEPLAFTQKLRLDLATGSSTEVIAADYPSSKGSYRFSHANNPPLAATFVKVPDGSRIDVDPNSVGLGNWTFDAFRFINDTTVVGYVPGHAVAYDLAARAVSQKAQVTLPENFAYVSRNGRHWVARSFGSDGVVFHIFKNLLPGTNEALLALADPGGGNVPQPPGSPTPSMPANFPEYQAACASAGGMFDALVRADGQIAGSCYLGGANDVAPSCTFWSNGVTIGCQTSCSVNFSTLPEAQHTCMCGTGSKVAFVGPTTTSIGCPSAGVPQCTYNTASGVRLSCS